MSSLLLTGAEGRIKEQLLANHDGSRASHPLEHQWATRCFTVGALGDGCIYFVLHLVLFRADDSTDVSSIATIFDIFWREQVGGRDRYGTNLVKS